MTRPARILALAAFVGVVRPPPSSASSASASSASASSFSAGKPIRRRRASNDAPLDAESVAMPSTESSFDHMIDLLPPEGPVRLSFHWNDPSEGSEEGGAFVGRLVHRAPTEEVDAGWLGFGVYDVPSRGVPTSSSDLMVGSQAVIGNVAADDVSKYLLGAKEIGPGGVERMDASFQTLNPTETSIVQHKGDDGHVNTILTFEKALREMDDAEIEIKKDEHNAFLYAVGPPAGGDDPEALGFHMFKGGFLLNFDAVSKKLEGQGSTAGGDAAGGDAAGGDAAGGDAAGAAGGDTAGGDTAGAEGGDTAGEDTAGEDTAGEDTAGAEGKLAEGDDAPIAQADEANSCQSDDPAFLHMIQLYDGLALRYGLKGDALTVQLTYDGQAWLGFGVSPDGSGNMVGSEAVIGRPDLALADEEKPLKYKLGGKSVEGVAPLPEPKQTLREASIVEEDGRTILTYTKVLSEEGEHAIGATGFNTFIYAIGNSNTLAFHKHSGSFRLDLTKCASPESEPDLPNNDKEAEADGQSNADEAGPDRPSNAKEAAGSGEGGTLTKTALWMAHGVVATAAWAIFTPTAVTTAWFRTLVPSSWIYVHVFSNVASFALTALALIIAVVTMSLGGGSGSHFSDVHHFVGLGMLVVVTFQVGNGFLRPPVEKRDPYADEPGGIIPCPQTAREWWKIGHRTIGAALLCVGFWQITTGLDLYARGTGTASLKEYFMYYFIVYAVVIVALRVWMWCEERRARRTVDMMGDGGDQMGGHMGMGDQEGDDYNGMGQ